VVLGARLPAFGLAMAALVLSANDQTSIPAIAGYTLAAVLLLIPGDPLPVRNPLPILLGAAWAVDYTLPSWVQSALLVALMLWTLIDERILLAAGLALFATLITATDDVATVTDTRGLLILASGHPGRPGRDGCRADLPPHKV
jgi:hypothetical protein